MLLWELLNMQTDFSMISKINYIWNYQYTYESVRLDIVYISKLRFSCETADYLVVLWELIIYALYQNTWGIKYTM